MIFKSLLFEALFSSTPTLVRTPMSTFKQALYHTGSRIFSQRLLPRLRNGCGSTAGVYTDVSEYKGWILESNNFNWNLWNLQGKIMHSAKPYMDSISLYILQWGQITIKPITFLDIFMSFDPIHEIFTGDTKQVHKIFFRKKFWHKFLRWQKFHPQTWIFEFWKRWKIGPQSTNM